MKRIHQYLVFSGLGALLCLFMVVPANAQHRGGGGGGGSHSSGGGGRSFSGGGRSFSGGSGRSFSGGARAGAQHYSGTRPGVSTQRTTSAGGSSFAQRQRSGAASYSSRAGGLSASRGYASRGYGHTGYRGIGRRGGYFYSHGYYGSLYFPMLGLGFGYLPYGYYPFFWGDDQYYFSDGYYYQHINDQYTVVEPPVGAAINALPSNAQSIVINGQQYYEDNGVYYAPITDANGKLTYQIAGKDGELTTNASGGASVTTPKVGDVTTTLPSDCRKISINGKTLYVSGDGIYYQQSTDENNNQVYKIVGIEGDGPGAAGTSTGNQ